MDQDLIAYLDERFRESSRLHKETNQQIADLRQETNQQFVDFRQETNQQFADFRQEANQQFSDFRQETNQQFADFRQETTQRFEKMEERSDRLETAIRHTQVMVESLRGEIQLVAEGVMSLEERLRSSQNEVLRKIEGVQGAIVPYYQDLDSRIRLLEERAKREGQAPLDYLRERYGKTARSSD